jgi:hypothetical protein
MWDNGEFDRREEVWSKASTFVFRPCKSCIVILNEVVHEVSFFWPQEITRVVLVDDLFSFEELSRGGDECRRRVGIKFRHMFEGVARNIANNVKSIWEVGNDWVNFECNWLVLLLQSCEYRV